MATARIHHRAGDYQKQGARLFEIDRLLRGGRLPASDAREPPRRVGAAPSQRDFDYLRYTLGPRSGTTGDRRAGLHQEDLLPAAPGGDGRRRALPRSWSARRSSSTPAPARRGGARGASGRSRRRCPEAGRTAAAWVTARSPSPTSRRREPSPRQVWQAVLGSLRTSRDPRASHYAKPAARRAWREGRPLGPDRLRGRLVPPRPLPRQRNAPRTFLLPRIEATEAHREPLPDPRRLRPPRLRPPRLRRPPGRRRAGAHLPHPLHPRSLRRSPPSASGTPTSGRAGTPAGG